MINELTTAALNAIKVCLNKGGIISFPTDTVYALACDATNNKAIEKLFNLKRRNILKTAPILVKDLISADKLVQFNPKTFKIAQKFWPGQLTMVLPIKTIVNISNLCIRDDTIGLRVPANESALKILHHCDLPLIATSVNYSGNISLNDPHQIHQLFGNDIDILVNNNIQMQNNNSSTVIKVINNILEIVRIGEISEKEILEVFNDDNILNC